MSTLFCARQPDNTCVDEHDNGSCEGRTHFDPGKYDLRGDEPRCNVCKRLVGYIYSYPVVPPIEGDTVRLESGEIVRVRRVRRS